MATGDAQDQGIAIGSRATVEILPLTGLRALAAIAVVVHHIKTPPSAPHWMWSIAHSGFIGVPLFFMLSGFVLAYNYPGLDASHPRSVLRFWIARVARVMPLYWAALAWVVLSREFKNVPQDDSLWMHVSAVQTWSSDPDVAISMYNAPGWSIGVELFLYALFPLLIPVIAGIARRRPSALLLVLGITFAIQVGIWAYFALRGWGNLPDIDPRAAVRWLYRFPPTRLPEFVVGMTIAFLHRRRTPRSDRHASLIQGGIVVFTLAMSALRDMDSQALSAAFYGTLWTIPFGLLIFSLAGGRGFLARFLSTPGMVALGAASYALYITHRGLLPGLGMGYVKTASGIWPYVAILVVLALTMLIAEGAHRYVEVPCRRFIMAWCNRLLPASSVGHKSSLTARKPQVDPAPSSDDLVIQLDQPAPVGSRRADPSHRTMRR